MENHHVSWVNPLYMAISKSHVSFPEVLGGFQLGLHETHHQSRWMGIRQAMDINDPYTYTN